MATRAESGNAAVVKTFNVFGNNLPKLKKKKTNTMDSMCLFSWFHFAQSPKKRFKGCTIANQKTFWNLSL